jgi:hypothetical protein
MGSPRDLSEMKEMTGRDDATFFVSEDGGIWIDSVDVNRILLHAGLPGLESMGGKANVDAIGDRCPKDDVDLIMIEGGDKGDPLVYGICEVCGGIWIDLNAPEDTDADGYEAEVVAFFRDFRRVPAGIASRSVRT